MVKNLFMLTALAIVIALPFVFRRDSGAMPADQPGTLTLVAVSPHNEAIRYEFERGFSRWHQAKYGQPVHIEWRSIGGTTEISRYLASEYAAAVRHWWTSDRGNAWPGGATEAVIASRPPADAKLAEIYNAYRAMDDAGAFTVRIDVFFGGGQFDHSNAFDRGFTVAPWPVGHEPAGLFATPDGIVLMPQKLSGETWRTNTLFGNALSTFGICYNLDRLRELKMPAPTRWDDLADGHYFKQVGVADPDKSGSIAKAFEMIVHQKCYQRVTAEGFSDADIAAMEAAIGKLKWQPGAPAPAGQPKLPEYQAAIEAGWIDGIRLIQRIGANARYFTDSASKVPIDVSVGDAAVGMAIDFYARFQAQVSRAPDGSERMLYVTPKGGSSVSCDPVSLLRGAEHRELGERFIEFVLSEDGQKLWNFAPGTPGGPERFALRRIPLRRDFYPSTQPAIERAYEAHRPYTTDPLGDPEIDPYQLALHFTYYPRWTGKHFGVQRKIIKAMCMDSADELREAWGAILDHGGPSACPRAIEAMERLPTISLRNPAGGVDLVPLNWRTAPDILNRYDVLDVMREWSAAFRGNYAEAARLAASGSP